MKLIEWMKLYENYSCDWVKDYNEYIVSKWKIIVDGKEKKLYKSKIDSGYYYINYYWWKIPLDEKPIYKEW